MRAAYSGGSRLCLSTARHAVPIRMTITLGRTPVSRAETLASVRAGRQALRRGTHWRAYHVPPWTLSALNNNTLRGEGRRLTRAVMPTTATGVPRRGLIEKVIGIGSGHPVITFIGVIAAVPIAFWTMKLISLAVWQNKVIYMSWFGSEQIGTPKDFGMDYDDATITTSDGIKLSCWLIKQKNDYGSKPTVIYFSGNAGNISHRLEKIRKVLYRGADCNVLLVSYRGYGGSEGTPSETGLRKDAEAAFDYLLSRHDIDSGRIFAYGHSLGCGVAIHLAKALHDRSSQVEESKRKFVRGLILDNGFTSVSDMVSHIYPAWTPYVLFKSILLRNYWENEKDIASLPEPLLVLAAEKDAQVPSWMSKKVFDSASNSVFKEFHSFRDGTHDDNWKQPNYANIVRDFIHRASEQSLKHGAPH